MARTVTVISALLLACLSIFCCYQYFQSNGGTPSFAMVTFAVGAIYGGFVGLDESLYLFFQLSQLLYLKTDLPSHITVTTTIGDRTRRFIKLLEDTLVVPFLAAEIWLKVGTIPPEAAYGHAIAAAIPILCELLDKSVNDDFQDALQAITAASLLAAGGLGGPNYYTIGAAVAYGLGRFSFRRGKLCMDFDCTAMYNFGLSCFTVCSMMALKGQLQFKHDRFIYLFCGFFNKFYTVFFTVAILK